MTRLQPCCYLALGSTNVGNGFCIETDWTVSPKTLFAVTDDAVFASRDNGNSWENIGVGLLQRPHCSDLGFVQQADGTRYLYLTSFGRSVWRTSLL